MTHFQSLQVILLFSAFFMAAQDKPAYLLYNSKGKTAEYKDMVKDLSKADMVFFGEHHTNPISHWLQLEVTQSLYESVGDKLILGAEMFENGNQLVMDEYLAGFYDEEKMIPEMTQMWKNYKTDYKPLLDFAKEKKIPFIATNIPRRYAAMINKDGKDALKKLSSEAAKMVSPDLLKYYDPNVKAYAEMKDQMGGHVPKNMDNIQLAQAAKDATMAHFMLKNYKKPMLFLHYQGSYHSDNDQGIIWWVNKLKPGLDIKSISTITRTDWDKLNDNEKAALADYSIVVPDNMTETGR
jgi:uncharacterized iron-regulated protein